MRLASANSAAVMLALCVLLLTMLLLVQIVHALGGGIGGAWMGVIGSATDYVALWDAFVARSELPAAYLSGSSMAQLLFGTGPALLTLCYWAYLVAAQCCRVRERRKRGASCCAAWCDAAKGGCAVRIANHKASSLPSSQRRAASCLWGMLCAAMLCALTMVGAAALHAQQGAVDVRVLALSTLSEASLQASALQNASAKLSAAQQAVTAATDALATARLPELEALLISSATALDDARAPASSYSEVECRWCIDLVDEIDHAGRQLNAEGNLHAHAVHVTCIRTPTACNLHAHAVGWPSPVALALASQDWRPGRRCGLRRTAQRRRRRRRSCSRPASSSH